MVGFPHGVVSFQFAVLPSRVSLKILGQYFDGTVGPTLLMENRLQRVHACVHHDNNAEIRTTLESTIA